MNQLLLKMPTVVGTDYFTEEVLMLLLVFCATIVGILITIWGYKYFKTFFIMAGCLISYYIGMKLMSLVSKQPVIQMVFFVSFTFIGTFVFLLISYLFRKVYQKMKIYKTIDSKLYLITGILGSLITNLVVAVWIYRLWFINLIGFILLSLIGVLYQRKSKSLRPTFHCYEDIYRMKLPKKAKKTI